MSLMRWKRAVQFLLVINLLLLPIFGLFPTAAFALEPGSYNVIGTEDFDYNLGVAFVKRNEEFSLDDEKISFYMLGCDMVSYSEQRVEFVLRSDEYGAKFVFIAPEAGRNSGNYRTADFYVHANSILRVKAVDKIIYEKIDGKWCITLGENDVEPELYLEDKKDWNEKLKFTGSGDMPFIIDLENYTISRQGYHFRMYHTFSPSSPLRDIDIEHTITFNSEQIMLRTFETRLSQGSQKTEIVVDRRPSPAIIGAIIRFTGNSDDGDNLATVTGVDENNHIVYINPVNSASYNYHNAGTWLRCFADYGNGQVYDNEYPKVNLEPSTWVIGVDGFNDIFDNIIGPNDLTGILGPHPVNISVDPAGWDSFGYGLRDVTYSYDGLNFTGGISGAFDVELALDFFGRDVTVGPLHMDYATMANSFLDQILRINTYKREAFRFYFNPYFFQSYCDWGGLWDPPDSFPLTFRIYFDKNFDLIGGNIKINLPGKGLLLPGGLAAVDKLGGGYTYPATFEVDASFNDARLYQFLPTELFWQADTRAVLSLDRCYLTLDGRIWMWDKKINVGDASATIAWSYYKGKRFKGLEFSGETGIGKEHINLVIDLKFKIKHYKSNGVTKSYIGGSGSATIEALGATFAGVGIKATTRKFSAWVNPPGPIGPQKITVYYKDIAHAISSLSVATTRAGRGVASLSDGSGATILLIPEAKRTDSQTPLGADLQASATDQVSTLNLPGAAQQAAITINYQGSISDITVAPPGGVAAPVVISDENTVEEPDKFYALDYALDDTQRQLFIVINNAAAGDYTVAYTTDTSLDTAIYEITQVPQIADRLVNATYNAGIVDLAWNLEQAIAGDVKYHLTLQALSDGQVIAQYPLYENMVVDDDGDDEDDGNEVEKFVDDEALTVFGTSVATRVRLPDNLPSGTYAFVVEPVLNNIDEDDLAGDAVTSGAFYHTNTVTAGIVTAPTGVSVENTGNGITRVQWELDPTVYSWDVLIRDTAGNRIGTASVLRENLMAGVNTYVDPLSMKGYVYLNIATGSNNFATATVSEAQYDTDYTFEVVAVQRIPHAVGDYYNSLLDFIDMNNIEADLNEGLLVHKASSARYTGRFIEATAVNFYVEIYAEGKDSPVFAANVFEGDTGEIGYTYDLDDDAEVESMRQIDSGALVMRTNAVDSLRLLPTDRPVKFGIAILSPSGSELLNIPALTLSEFTQPGHWQALAAELASNFPTISPETAMRLQQVYESGAVAVDTSGGIHVDMSLLASQGIVGAIESGRYTISLTAYNANNDKTTNDFEVVVRDIAPAPFLEKVVHSFGNNYHIVGFANGAATISLNGSSATVNDGLFELTTNIQSDTVEYEITDEFGNTYRGTIEYSDYSSPGGGGGSGGCFISSL